jgi:YcaO-like protein with predicted kinase domain
METPARSPVPPEHDPRKTPHPFCGFERLQARIGVTRIADITGLDVLGIPVCAAFRPSSRSVTVSQGKGLTAEAARLTALFEACELYHAETCEAALSASPDEIEGTHRYFDRFEPAHRAFDRSEAKRRIPWIASVEMSTGTPTLIPLEIVSMDHRIPRRKGFGRFNSSATGLAAHVCLDQALVHGLLECIERDRFSIWQRASDQVRAGTAIDPKSIIDPPARDLINRFNDAGLTVFIWDLSGAANVPVIMAELLDVSDSAFHFAPYCQGLGCAPSALEALRKALMEAAQTRLGYISGSRDDLSYQDYSTLPAALHANRAKIARNPGKARSIDTVPDLRPKPISGLIQVLVATAATDAHQPVFLATLTRPDIGVPAIKIVAPGLADELNGEPTRNFQSPAELT